MDALVDKMLQVQEYNDGCNHQATSFLHAHFTCSASALCSCIGIFYVGPATTKPAREKGNRCSIDACLPWLLRWLAFLRWLRLVSLFPSTDGSVAVAVAVAGAAALALALAAVRMRVRISHAYIISISNGDGRCMANNVMRVQIPWPALRTWQRIENEKAPSFSFSFLVPFPMLIYVSIVLRGYYGL